MARSFLSKISRITSNLHKENIPISFEKQKNLKCYLHVSKGKFVANYDSHLSKGIQGKEEKVSFPV